MYEPKIGDVVLNNDMRMVVLDFINNEDEGSCSYDRHYKLCLYDEIVGKDMVCLEKLGYWVTVRGSKFPTIEKCTDVAPFEIKKVNMVSIRQMKPKTITIYE